MFTDAFGKIWYKGNLHTHTTNSDGAYAPEETIALYKSKGYDFLALTDHWFHGEGRQEENFLLLNGTEFDVGSTVQEGIYHIVGIGMEKAPALTKRAPGLSAQKIIALQLAAPGSLPSRGIHHRLPHALPKAYRVG